VSIADLPALNASLNALAAVFLTTGYVLIRRGRRTAHKRAMLLALITSSIFLASYVVYHVGIGGSRPFTGQGAIRPVYYSILITHVILAMAVLPLALITTARGLRSQFDRHVPIARWTLPIWLYVSVTGVLVYWMLYRL
jgi:putative membrane protein